MVLVDSSVWIEGARRQGRLEIKVALEAVLEEYEAAICSPIRLEVLGSARREDREKLDYYFACIPYIQVKESDWTAAIKQGWMLRDQGITLPWNDLLIATLALRLECRLFACDRHFELMKPPLLLRLYQPGYGGSFQSE